jgi:phospho-N-acetylmuramoyl-pentapeptide-transferase
MLSGFLDDKSRDPWGEYKKGVIDLAIAVLATLTFIIYNPDLMRVSLGSLAWNMPKAVFAIAGIILVWVSINATNCSDGIDGFSGTLSIISMVSIGISIFLLQTDSNILLMITIMSLSILPYLWLNAEPSKILMGDAGSRAIGLFISIAILKTGNILLLIPFCFVLLFNGMAGIVKVSLIRFLHLNLLKNIRTPLHDHFRINNGWSNTQTIFRLCIIQVFVSALTIILLKR